MDNELQMALNGLENSLTASIERKMQQFNANGYINQNDPIEELITKNFENIKGVNSGSNLLVKATTDMTLGGHLTGDEPKTYGGIIMKPGQKLNISDLVRKVPIENGVLSIPREVGGEGNVDTQVEGTLKNQLDFDLDFKDYNTEYIAGLTVFSKKMRNNLGFLNAFIPHALRRAYNKAENRIFDAILTANATPSTEIITSQNKAEMLINDLAKLEEKDYSPSAIVIRPLDFYDILKTEKSAGSGYSLPGIFSYENGTFHLNGIPIVKATWLDPDSYFIGDWSRIYKVVTDEFSIQFSEEDKDNFSRNNITCRAEQQTTLAVPDSDALVKGMFNAV